MRFGERTRKTLSFPVGGHDDKEMNARQTLARDVQLSVKIAAKLICLNFRSGSLREEMGRILKMAKEKNRES